MAATGKKEAPPSKYNEIQQVAIWRESLRKERALHKLSEDFTIHPKSLTLYAENPMRKRDERRMASRSVDPAFEAEFQSTLRHSLKEPVEKNAFPATAGQEYGFFVSVRLEKDDDRASSMSSMCAHAHVSTSGSRFYFPRTSCDVTQYGEAVVKSGVASSKRDPAAKGGKPGK